MAYFTHLVAQLPLSKNNIYSFIFPLLARFHPAAGFVRRRCAYDASSQPRRFQVQTSKTRHQSLPSPSLLLDLPRTCPGCGAITQFTDPSNPGFYGINRKSVSAFVTQRRRGMREAGEKAPTKREHDNLARARNLGMEQFSDNSKGLP